jgi:hypothetical protein
MAIKYELPRITTHLACLLISLCLIYGCGQVSEPYSPLMQSVKAGNIDDVQELLQSGASVNKRTALQKGFSLRIEGSPFYGESALMLAIDAGYNDIADELLSQSANISLSDSWGRNSWDRACANLYIAGRLSALELLTEYADIPKEDACYCLIQSTVNVASIDLVIPYYDESYCVAHYAYFRRDQPVARAIFNGDVDAFRALEQKGFSIPDEPIILSVQSSLRTGQTELLGYLLEGGYQGSGSPEQTERLEKLLNSISRLEQKLIAARIRKMLLSGRLESGG